MRAKDLLLPQNDRPHNHIHNQPTASKDDVQWDRDMIAQSQVVQDRDRKEQHHQGNPVSEWHHGFLESRSESPPLNLVP